MLIGGLAILANTNNDTVYVDVNIDLKRSLGGVEEFERDKYITIHADVSEREWDGDNEVADLRDHFLNGYDVYMGRNTGGIQWYMNNLTPEDENRSGYADTISIAQNGTNIKTNYSSNANWHAYENRNAQILCAQLHPFYPDGQETQKGWAFSTADTNDEPFGTASGEYMAHFIKETYGTGGNTGQPRPNLIEVVNEPLWHLVDYGDEEPEKIFRFHNAVADQIKKHNDNIDVGGFCTAFPDLEKNNFTQWEERWKLFMDVAGEKMDFWTIHLYDFPSINNGKQLYRKGAQMEGTFDMMEQYSFMKFGKVKPFMISEYGAQMHDYMNQWSPYRDWLHVKSCNAMVMQFMERTNIINKTINFLPVKAEWGYSEGKTYNHRLMRKANEPDSYTGKWVYSDMVQFYQLWSDVKGIRVDSKASDVDVMVDAYVNGDKLYLIITNLLFEDIEIQTNRLGVAEDYSQLRVKHLFLNGNEPELTENTYGDHPKSFKLGAEGSMILEYTYPNNIELGEQAQEQKYYAEEYYKAIKANTAEVFHINSVELGTYGEATLRIGIGRNHGKNLKPEVTINGTALSVPSNYRGDDQKDRPTFFGVLEIPVPYDLLDEDNTIEVTFNDDGGHISSLTMRAIIFSREVKRFESAPDVGIKKLSLDKIKIAPNPAQSNIEVSSKGTELLTGIKIYTLSGNIVLNQAIHNNTTNVQVAHLPRGIYLFLVNTNNGEYSHKLVLN